MNVKLVRIFDKFVISVIVIIVGIITSILPKKPRTNKILIIKMWALGDSVVSLPMTKGLRKNLPDSRIEVLAHKRNKAAFMNNKDIDRIIEFNLANVLKLFRKYDICIDTEPYLNISAIIAWWAAPFRIGFSHGVRSLLYKNKILFSKKQHMVQNYLDMIRSMGIRYNADKLVKLETTKKEKAAAERFLKKNSIKKSDFIVGITPGVAESVKTRMWPIDRMAELADTLIRKNKAKVILIDGPVNREIVNSIKKQMNERPILCVGDLSIREVFNLIERCNLFICNDTGPMHIAAAQGARTIGLFGPNTPVLWRPYGKGNIALYHPPWCSPCIDNAKGIMPECFNKVYQKCMKNITFKEVLEAVNKLKNAR